MTSTPRRLRSRVQRGRGTDDLMNVPEYSLLVPIDRNCWRCTLYLRLSLQYSASFITIAAYSEVEYVKVPNYEYSFSYTVTSTTESERV